MTTALLDGDIIAYRCAAAAQKPSTWESFEKDTFDEKEMCRAIDEMVNKWTHLAGCWDYRVLLTQGFNFRHLVSPTYKANRKNIAKPLGLAVARQHLVARHKADMVYGLEADDLIGLMLTGSMKDRRGIAVSLDKDLRTIPGWHFNPSKDNPPFLVDELAADRWWFTQTLTGDAVDGYPGARGIGPTKAEKLLAPTYRSVGSMWPRVVQGFKSDTASALEQARLARILRRGDYDRESRTVLLWHPTKPEPLKLPDEPGEPAGETA